MKNTQGGIISKITDAKEYINDLQDRTVKITATEKNWGKKRMENLKNEDSLEVLWDNIKCASIHIIGLLEGERERTQENI